MQTLLKRWTHALLEWLGLTSATGDALDRWAAFVLVVLAAVVFDLLLQLGIVHGVRKLVERTRAKWDDTLFSVPVLRRMCHILSAILLAVVLPVVFEEKSTGRVIVLRFMEAYIVFSVFRFVNALLYAAFHIAAARPAWQNKPIKGLRQTAQGIALLICTILIVSILLDKSPAILLTGLGASAAVLMLISVTASSASFRAFSSRPTTCSRSETGFRSPSTGPTATSRRCRSRRSRSAIGTTRSSCCRPTC